MAASVIVDPHQAHPSSPKDRALALGGMRLPDAFLAASQRYGALVVPHDPDRATYLVAFTLAPTVAMDLLTLGGAGNTRVARLRQLVIVNPGSQTAAALVTLQLGRAGALGSGGAALTKNVLDPDNDPASITNARGGDTTLAAGFAEWFKVYVQVPAAAAAFTEKVIDFGGPAGIHKVPYTAGNGVPGPLVLRHPGAAGAAGFHGYAIFTEERA